MSKPNFIITTRTIVDVDYEAFKEDFLNPYLKVDYLKEKYGMSNSDWRYYRNMVLEDTGLSRKPSYNRMDCVSVVNDKCVHKPDKKPDLHIRKVDDNNYIIVKSYGHGSNRDTKYHGRYPDIETARMVRDKLIECDWDYNVSAYLKNKYGVDRKKPAYLKALDIYPVFEDYYFHSKLKITEICDKLNITLRMYEYLIQMIRENHDVQRRNIL